MKEQQQDKLGRQPGRHGVGRSDRRGKAEGTAKRPAKTNAKQSATKSSEAFQIR
jgi:hypothetical protein